MFGCAGSSLRCGLFSGCGKQGLLPSYGAQASVTAESGLSSGGSRALERSLSSCGARAQLFHIMWNLPKSETEPVCPLWAGRFFTTELSGKLQGILILMLRTY